MQLEKTKAGREHPSKQNKYSQEKLQQGGPILESKGMRVIFQKKGKKVQNILKFAIIARNKLLEKALPRQALETKKIEKE